MDNSKNLSYLIKNMNPVHVPGTYVFTKVPSIPSAEILENVFSIVREDEGITLILTKETASQLDLDHTESYALISLKVASSLEAVGLTAHFSKYLTQANIPANVVAGYHHDHIFVPYKKVSKALEVLKAAQQI